MVYKVLEHTADLKIRITADSKPNLFKNSVRAMFEAAGYQGQDQVKSRTVQIESEDLLSLMVNFLSEALYLSEVNKEVYSDIEIEQFSDKKIEGKLRGKELENVETIIKGVTYHDLDISEQDDEWKATILFDI